MATQIGDGQLSEEQIQELNDYLFSLQPEGGCELDVTSGATPGASPVASPMATPATD